MFLGHFGLGLGAKRVAPALSLGALFLACQFADLLWPLLVLLGVEQVAVEPGVTVVTPLNFISYPYSHSLLTLCIWGLLFGGIYAVVTRSKKIAVVTLAALVVSHWLLDFVTHRPDMPLLPFSTGRYGLNLWQSLGWTLVAECGLFSLGVWLYTGATRARDRIGSFGFWGLVVFLAAIMAANVLGPPPPSAAAVAWTVQAMWLIVLWGAWVDRHRYPR